MSKVNWGTFKSITNSGDRCKYHIGMEASSKDIIIVKKLASNELQPGFELIRKFGNIHYQHQVITFKLSSFEYICDILNHLVNEES